MPRKFYKKTYNSEIDFEIKKYNQFDSLKIKDLKPCPQPAVKSAEQLLRFHERDSAHAVREQQ